jgi:heat-inducible transcriptional repressor
MLTKRQETILNIIVDDYTKTATPIASETIVRNHNLGVSSATIRNDVAALEDAGYIARPHTSAGSVPLDKAYRLYVETLMGGEVGRIPPEVRAAVRRQLSEIERDVDEWANIAAAVLARLVGNMAVATFPRAKESRVRHFDLVQIQDFLVMLIVVLEQARLRRQLIRLTRPLELVQLEDSINRLRANLMGLSRREIESKDMKLSPLEEELVDATLLVLREEENAIYRDHYVDGLRNLLGQPEFAENERTRAIVEGVESGSLIQAILDETPDGGIVRVIIGQENRGDMLSPLSIVICQYGIPEEAVGAVGVVGPTRMQYSKTIAGVRFMSSALSDLVEVVHGA